MILTSHHRYQGAWITYQGTHDQTKNADTQLESKNRR